MRTSLKRSAAVVGAGVLVLGVSGVAYAFWTTTGSGSGTAATGDAVALKINQTNVPSGLAPGLPAVDITGTFTNSATGATNVVLSSISLVSLTTGVADCAPSNYAVTELKVVDGKVDAGAIAAGAWTGKIQLVESGKNQDACKLATPTLTYAAS